MHRPGPLRVVGPPSSPFHRPIPLLWPTTTHGTHLPGCAAGLAAGCRAIDVGVELAQQYGVATVVVANSRHAGPMSAYTARAAAQDCIAVAMTSTPPAMRMHNGTRPFLGTNPIAVGAPRPAGGHFSLDMATTAMANGKLAITAAADKPMG